ncbi:MAG: acetylglutamate kinase [Acidobacteria bacterium]|nr:acetylglutamate kinase [Acidobacteriota bacterium]
MRILVKLGGTLLDAPASRARLARELAAVQSQGVELVVVHGGGKQMTRFLAERGVESRFVEGLRVTTPEVLDAVLKVFAGSVNHELVAAFVAAGAQAVGLSGIDAALAEAEQMRPELGAVGRIVRANAGLLRLLTAHAYLPVVACVAGDRDGRIYNVNADQMAVACAAGFAADKLFFLTDVDGVRGADGTVVPCLTPEDANRLIAGAVATGGMQAKLTAAVDGLRKGVGEVVIGPGDRPGIVQRLLDREAAGSRLVAG